LFVISDETGVIDWSITSSRTASANNSFEHHGRQHFDTDWKQTFSVTLSFADGAPARTHAIQSALRPYRPQYYHFYQLKTFWHDSKIWYVFNKYVFYVLSFKLNLKSFVLFRGSP